MKWQTLGNLNDDIPQKGEVTAFRACVLIVFGKEHHPLITARKSSQIKHYIEAGKGKPF